MLLGPRAARCTSGPNRSVSWSSVAPVSSTVSWSSPVMTVDTSAPCWANMLATSSGWVTYGSPECRNCPR
eukprot:scaffold184460_cov30-Tisochrysis_lutea.AAC.4